MLTNQLSKNMFESFNNFKIVFPSLQETIIKTLVIECISLGDAEAWDTRHSLSHPRDIKT